MIDWNPANDSIQSWNQRDPSKSQKGLPQRAEARRDGCQKDMGLPPGRCRMSQKQTAYLQNDGKIYNVVDFWGLDRSGAGFDPGRLSRFM